MFEIVISKLFEWFISFSIVSILQMVINCYYKTLSNFSSIVWSKNWRVDILIFI